MSAENREIAVVVSLLKNYWSLLQRFYDSDKQQLPRWNDSMFKEQEAIIEVLADVTKALDEKYAESDKLNSLAKELAGALEKAKGHIDVICSRSEFVGPTEIDETQRLCEEALAKVPKELKP
jgi:hypothetical protein